MTGQGHNNNAQLRQTQHGGDIYTINTDNGFVAIIICIIFNLSSVTGA